MNFRDVEFLSAYLDGQLNPSDSARIESRIKADPELASVLADLRAARGLLRKLPSRRAPRDFTLTPQMAGLKAPTPRAYPALRFASVFAALLFFLTYATNFAAPRLRAALAPAYGYGMGGGGGGAAESSVATEAPAATEAPLLAPAATQPPEEGQPLTQMQPMAPTTATPSTAEDATRIMETPAAKNAGPQESANAPQPEVREETFLPVIWQWSFGILALLLGLVAWLSNLFSERAFRKKIK